MAFSLAGKVAELNLGQYDPELLRLAVRQAVNPAEAASHLRDIQVCAKYIKEPGALRGGYNDFKTCAADDCKASHKIPRRMEYHTCHALFFGRNQMNGMLGLVFILAHVSC